MYNTSQYYGWLPFIISLLLMSACREDPVDIPSITEFTKADRERLGDLLKEEILADEIFPMFSEANFSQDSIYWYIQTLYNQATNSIRFGRPNSNNHWSAQRQWEILLIDEPDRKIAFVLPGGHLFLSTGLLKSLERSYELYYFLAFEATLMEEMFLFKRLIEEYNALTIRTLLDGQVSANAVTLDIIAKDLPNLIFEAETVFSIDEKAIELICETSLFDRKGIARFLLDDTNNQSDWLVTRNTYANRVQQLTEFENAKQLDCGDFRGNGDYETFVLKAID